MSKKNKKLNKRKQPLKQGIIDKLSSVRWALLIVAIVSFAIYASSLNNGLVHLDDDMMFENMKVVSQVSEQSILKEAFSRDAMVGIGGDLYRPMQTFMLLSLYKAGAGGTFSFHLFQLLLHIVSACLIYMLFLKMRIESNRAFVVSLIFAAHPLFVSSVSFIPSIGDQLLTCFGLASFIFFINYYKDRKLRNLGLSMILFAFAMLSKETAIGLPLLFAFYAYIDTLQNNKNFAAVRILWPSLAISLSFVFIYFLLRHAHVVPEMVSAHNKLTFENFFANFWYNKSSFFEFLSKFFWPVGLAFLSSYNITRTIFGALIFSAVLVLWYYKKEERGRIIFAVLWYVVFVMPPMLYKNPVFDYGEHRAYLPMIAWLLLIAALKINNSVFNKLLFVVPVLAVMSHVRTADFKNPITFYDAIIANEQVPIAYLNRGAYLHKNNAETNLVLKDYDAAIALKPDYATALYNRGILKSENLGKIEEALNDLDKALEAKPNYADAYYHRGYVKVVHLGDIDGGLSDMEAAVKHNRRFVLAYYNKGLVYFNFKNEPEKALSDFNNAIKYKPFDNSQAYFSRALAYQRLGHIDKACADWQTAKAQKHVNAENMLQMFCRGDE